ncbi:HAD family hydrolase [Chloroflexota bacterium]
MKYKAVIFDLFGTLVDVFSLSEHEEMLKNLGAVIDVPYEEFRPVWYEATKNRNIGIYPTSRENIVYICKKLGVSADEQKVERALEIRFEFVRRAMVPRNDAVQVLSQIRTRGMKTGLISNSTPIVTEIWPETPFPPHFDTAVFSCTEGIKKPDMRIYRLALERLRIKPEDCLYIGDGDSNELTGAGETGMYPVLIRVDYETDPDHTIADRQEWDGPMISSLTEVLELVK